MRKVLLLVVGVVAGVVAFVVVGGESLPVGQAIAGVLASDDKFEGYLTGDRGPRVQLDERASVEFPAEPARSVEAIPIEGMEDTEMVVFEVAGDALEFAASYCDFPGLSGLDAAQRKEVLQAAARGAADGVDGELTTWLERPFKDRDAIEFTVRQSEDVYAKGEVLIDGDRAYFLVSTDDRNPPRSFERFVHSLQLA